MSDFTPSNKIPTVPQNTMDPAAGLNLSLDVIDALLNTRVVDMIHTAPPSSPSDGDMYVVSSPATGAWAGHENDVARYDALAAAWDFFEAGVTARQLINSHDGVFYIWRSDSSANGWVPAAGIPDAPFDGTIYGRQNGSWVEAGSGGGGMTNPMIAAGDLIVGGPGGTPERLPVGTEGQVLTSRSGTWVADDPSGGAAARLGQTKIATGVGSTMQYKSEPNLLYMADGRLLCAYRKGSSHVNADGQIVGKISSDNGATWGTEFIIYDDPTYDARNHGLGLDAGSGKIVVFLRTYNTSTNHNNDIGYVTSSDNGATWSSFTSVASILPASIDWCPFGRITLTSVGWLMAFYQENKCYLLKSTNGGTTWSAQGYVYNLSQSAKFNEPSMIALDSNRIIMIIRDDESASYNLFRYYKSSNGGSTWSFFAGIQYTTSSQSLATPCHAVKIDNQHVGVVFGARTDANAVCYSVVDLDTFFQIAYVGWDGTTSQRPPRDILSFARKKFDPSVTSVTDSDFGYAFPVVIPGTDTVLVAWYDTGDGTNLNCDVIITGAPVRR